ncbi:MAG: hypothetical protein Q8N12_04280 [Thermodesulfovibrionales bacterium]|nr:SurA N-terminal domain-containing protein [Nitrospinota bacterium]MCG2710095.1 SurA N-terminal domain-containing protein [Thermodesulfovibrionales bacterium]MCG2814013.1 SurA N-terminal domain-containing protein [Thermodesulfovibrionales bacterium]MDP3048635.1 hypothetical protein [Thermodesulfovibrionales bacterium]
MKQLEPKKLLLLLFLNLAVLLAVSLPAASAETIDRVIAFVDDKAITLSELDENYKTAVKPRTDIKKEEVLNTMINRMLLLREAKKLRIEGANPDEVIREYIELKLKTFIKITEDDLREFYEKNRKEFGKTDFDDAREKIEEYLVEKEVNIRLKKHIEDLRTKAYIKIQLDN